MILRFPINALSSWLGAKQILESAAEFVEPGASATDDRRPVFQQMIERACDGEHAFDVIAVHSYSRFFRDAFGQEFYLRKLAKHGYRLIEVEKRGTKVKKALAIDAVDSETVRLIFKLYLYVAEVDDVLRDRLNMLKMLPRSLGKACLIDLHCVSARPPKPGLPKTRQNTRAIVQSR